MNEDIDLKQLGITKALALTRLFNASKAQGMGFLQNHDEPMTETEAEKLLSDDRNRKYFDYVRGRILKVNLTDDTFSPRLYDRDNGQGAALRALQS